MEKHSLCEEHRKVTQVLDSLKWKGYNWIQAESNLIPVPWMQIFNTELYKSLGNNNMS